MLCIDIIHAVSYSLSIVLVASNVIDIILLTSYYTTPHRCSCHSESCANHARKLATILAASYLLSSSPPLTRYRPRHVLLALILIASYSLSYSPCPTLYRPRCRRPHCHPADSHRAHHVVIIASYSSCSAHSVGLIMSCSSRQAYRVVLLMLGSWRWAHGVALMALGSSHRTHSVGLIASCPICQPSFVSHTQSNATRIKTELLHVMIAAMDVTLGACAGNVKSGSSIYRCTLDIKNRTGLSHYAWNPLRICECDASIYCDALYLDSQCNHDAMTHVVWMPFALTWLRPEGKYPETATSRRKMP